MISQQSLVHNIYVHNVNNVCQMISKVLIKFKKKEGIFQSTQEYK